jgi:predicted amidohydrolase
MRAAAFQFDVRTNDPEHNLRRVEEGLAAAADAGVELVVLPEVWPTSFLPADADIEEELERSRAALARVAALSRELSLVVCGSTLAESLPGELPVNRLHVLDRGELVLAYDKVHLFSPTAEDESFTPGAERPPTSDTNAGRVSGVVCYDLRFPEVCRFPFRDRAEVLVVPAQWPVARAAHWRALAIGRAIENQCAVVACNRTGEARIGRRGMQLAFPGNSLVVSAGGEVLAEGRGEEGLVVADVELEEAARLRVRVPIAKDQRPELYARW